jgi:hypothetical protein
MAERLDPQLGKARKISVGITRPEHKCDPLGQEPSSDKRERLGGCTVEPLRIVDHAEERLPLGSFRQQAENRQSDEEWTGRNATTQAERNTERLALRQREVIDQVEDRRTQLLQGCVVELHLPFDACGSNDAEVIAGLGRAFEQRCLADTRVAVHHEHRAMAVVRCAQQAFEQCSLALPTDQTLGSNSHSHSKSMPTKARLRIYGIRSKEPREQDRESRTRLHTHIDQARAALTERVKA